MVPFVNNPFIKGVKMGHVSARNAELAALEALRASYGAAILGFQFDRGLTGTVTVFLSGRALGAWWFDDGVYKFARIARRPACILAVTPEAVVSRTVAMAVHADFSFPLTGRHQPAPQKQNFP